MQHSQQVREFHDKHSYDVDLSLKNKFEKIGSEVGTSILHTYARILNDMSSSLESGTPAPGQDSSEYDPRLLRAHLMLEELAETIEGLAQRNELKVLDGLADLSYVTHGTAVTFGLPLDAAFDEVHRSNMTKGVRHGDVRLRTKGEDYQPPDLQRVLDCHRGA